MADMIHGRVRKLGDDINTDYIIASHRKRDSLDPAVLKQYLFESIDPGFAASVADGDLLVAGKNFGCGSAMEVAVTVILGAGIRTVLARSFARTFFRNAINNGLLPIACDTAGLAEGDRLSIALGDAITVTNERDGRVLAAEPMPGIMRDILGAGGVVPYLREHREFKLAPAC